MRKGTMKKEIQVEEKGMSAGLKFGIAFSVIVIGILAIIGSFIWGSYNTMTIAHVDMDTQWANVQTEYQRRGDLIINMAEIAKGYAGFEMDTLTAVAKARSMISTGNTQVRQEEGMTQLDGAISRLLLVFEQYPQLKTVEQYNKLSDEMANTENRINIARTDYNSVVRSYNILISTFPKNLIASAFNFEKGMLFEADKGTETAPKLDMKL